MSVIDYPAPVVAQAIHAAFMVLQDADKDPKPAPHWRYLEPEMRANVIAGVDAIRGGMTPAENHERWRTFLTAQGWRYGRVKDARTRTHPLLIPWGELLDSVRLRDEMFAAIVRALTPSMTRKD